MREMGGGVAAMAVALVVMAAVDEAAAATDAMHLKPSPLKAEKAVEQALRRAWTEEEKQGVPPTLIYKDYDCTRTVPVLPPRMAIHADSCSLWRKTGHVEDEYKKKLIDFGLNCLSLSPTDIDFITAAKDPAFRTREKYYDWGVKITVMDCNGEPMAIIKENLLHSFAHTPRAEYVVELPDGQEVARSKQGSFLSDTLMIFNTDEDEDGDGEVSDEEAEAADAKPPEPLAYARVSRGGKLRGQFCMGGTWRLNINEYATNFWEDPRTREVLMVLATVKAVRDADRDHEGRVKEARCDEGFWLSIILVPLMVLAVIIGFLCLPDNACAVLCFCFKKMKYHPV